MTDVKSALDVARTFGAALEEDLPLDGRALPGPHRALLRVRGAAQITPYYRLDPSRPGGMVRALAPLDRTSTGPC